MSDAYDLIVVGTGFASSFFLREYLYRARTTARVLVLERGVERSHAWQLENLGALHDEAAKLVDNSNSDKPWTFNVAFGGGSNCWWACTPRMLPSDFRLRSQYDVGVDWPVDYDTLEPYYCLAERWMEVSGPAESPVRRSEAYPQKPHRMSTPDEALLAAFSGKFFVQPTARARTAAAKRPGCCANATCSTCPVDAKFRIPTDFADLWKDPRIELRLGVPVERFDLAEDGVAAVHWGGATPGKATADRYALGANAIFNAHILLRSGHQHPEVGAGLVEQASVTATVDLDGMAGFDGSTSITGHGYMLYDGGHRRDYAAALMETMNVPLLRMEPGQWRNRVVVKLIYGDLRQAHNRVRYVEATPDKPRIEWKGHSDYTERAVARAEMDLGRVLKSLPVQSMKLSRNTTEAHIIGTVPMSADPATGVVNADLVDHQYRNLLVLGASAFPTAAPANPTLTLCALSIRAAERLFPAEVFDGPP